jgi:hypothetical protein
LVKKIIIVKNATACTWDWYCHLVVDRASLSQPNALAYFFSEKKVFLDLTTSAKVKEMIDKFLLFLSPLAP